MWGFPGGSDGKESACNAGGLSSIPGSGRSPGEQMTTQPSILAWREPWTEESGGLQSMELQKVVPDCKSNTFSLSLIWKKNSLLLYSWQEAVV